MNARPISRTHRSRRGFVMVTMILSLVILLAFLGLAIDVGYQEYIKTSMQNAADAAALGGAQELRTGGSDNLVASAKTDASTNGFTDGQKSVAITVNNPPLTGYSTGDTTAVEVLISQTVPTFFMQVLGFSSGTVQARAVAKTGSSSNCFYVLNSTMNGALAVSNGVGATLACGIIINSKGNTALTMTGGPNLSSPFIAVAGGYSVKNGASISPTPVQNVTPVVDPLASLPRPTVGNCADHPANTNVSGGNVTLYPGTYCRGLTLSNSANVTMKPGVYILKGGGMQVGGGSHVSGTDITFYNSYGSGYAYAPFTFDNGSKVDLAAPTTGIYAGILIFQDPTVVSSARNIFSGGTDLNLTGALYFPTTGLDISGGAHAAYTIIVADNVNFSGGIKINNDYSSLPSGSPAKGNSNLSE